MSDVPAPIDWRDDKLFLLDQRHLPNSEQYIEIKTLDECIWAIKEMVVRGAPCIGFTSIFGMALWLKSQSDLSVQSCRVTCDKMISARPTAVNLSFEVNNCFQLIEQGLHQNQDKTVILKKLIEMGLRQLEESFLRNSQMAKIGVEVLESTLKKSKWNLMTHCNTGFLACGSLGTALGVISHAHSLGKVEHVYADETRPFMQGTRLTAYELSKQNIPYSLVVEGAASFLLSNKMVDAIFVGADRIAANGDTANKVGTSTLAIVAKFYNIPFYVVAPVSSFDLSLSSGQDIQIEMRSMEEITELKGFKLAPDGAKSVNPSFDVTDHQLITGIICEKGLINPRKKDELIRVVNL